MATTTVNLSSGHTVRSTTLGELSAADFERWRALDARAVEPTPYLSADYLQPAAPHWPAALSIRLLIVEHGDQTQMIMPFRVMPLHRRVPISVLSTWDLTLADETFNLFPVLAADGGLEALRAGLAALSALALPRLVDIVTVTSDGPTYELIRKALPPKNRCYVRGRSQWPVAYIRVGGTSNTSREADTVPYHRSASTRKKANRYRRALEHDLGARLAVRDRSDDPNVIEDFLTLQAAGWKGDASKRGVAYRITGRAPWLHEVAERFRSRGQFTAFEIHAERRPMYLMLGFRFGRTVLGLQDAYDEAGAPHGLGNLARTAYINWLSGMDIETFDPNMFWGYTDSARFYPDHREHVRLLIAAPGTIPYLQVAAIRGAKNISDRLPRARGSVSRFVKRARGGVDHAPDGQ